MSRDYRDLFSAFNAQKVDYLVVGAHALAAHGHVRATKDLDIWVRPEKKNAQKVLRALASFGAPIHELDEKDLTEPGLIFQIGVAPLRIDILTTLMASNSTMPGSAAFERASKIRKSRYFRGRI